MGKECNYEVREIRVINIMNGLEIIFDERMLNIIIKKTLAYNFKCYI